MEGFRDVEFRPRLKGFAALRPRVIPAPEVLLGLPLDPKP